MSKRNHKLNRLSSAPAVTPLPQDEERLRETLFQLSESQLKASLADYFKRKGSHYKLGNGYLYVEGTHPVLLVAHLDTVHSHLPSVICKSDDGDVWMSPFGIGGDDRCGVYIILKLLEKFPCHVVFCEKEEVGGLGAKEFSHSEIKPDVNYIVEFDRKGHEDCVFYDCDNPDFTKFVEQFGFKEAYGSFSDISTIAPALGIAAVNLSSGYDAAHTSHEYVSFTVMQSVITRASEMLAHCDTFFKYIQGAYSYSYSGYSSYYGGSNYGKSRTVSHYPRSYNYNMWYDDGGMIDEWDDDGYNLVPSDAQESVEEYGEQLREAFDYEFEIGREYRFEIKPLFMFLGHVFDENLADYLTNVEEIECYIDADGKVYENVGDDVCIHRPNMHALTFDLRTPSFNTEKSHVMTCFTVVSPAEKQ